MTKYRVSKFYDKIDVIEIVKETAKLYYINAGLPGHSYEAKVSIIGSDIFDTWKQAHGFLLERKTKKVEAGRRSLERLNGELGNVRGMKNPDEKEGAK